MSNKKLALATVKAYYTHFNYKNWQGMLDLLHSAVRHEVTTYYNLPLWLKMVSA